MEVFSSMPPVWGMSPQLLAIIIMSICYLIIFSEKVNRAVIALLGAGLMIVSGILTQPAALKGIDFNTLALLTGMMIIVGIAEKSGGIPSLTAVIVVAVGIFGSIVGPFVMKVLGIESRIAKGLALGASSHGLGTSVAIQIGAVEGALSGLAIGLMGIMTAILVPVISFIISLF